MFSVNDKTPCTQKLSPSTAYLPGRRLTDTSNRKRSQQLFYLLNPLNNLTSVTFAHTYQTSGFRKAHEQGPQCYTLGPGKGEKWKRRKQVECLTSCCWWLSFNFITFDHLVSWGSCIWISYRPNSQGFPTKAFWQRTPHGEKQVTRREKKSKMKLCIKKKHLLKL